MPDSVALGQTSRRLHNKQRPDSRRGHSRLLQGTFPKESPQLLHQAPLKQTLGSKLLKPRPSKPRMQHSRLLSLLTWVHVVMDSGRQGRRRAGRRTMAECGYVLTRSLSGWDRMAGSDGFHVYLYVYSERDLGRSEGGKKGGID
jgi:hypothetical protein